VCRTDDPDVFDVICTRSLYDAKWVAVGELRAAHPAIAAEFEQRKPIDKMLIKQPKVTP
jgi:hypothetical protein